MAVVVDGPDPANGSDQESTNPYGIPFGTTVISPRTDGVLLQDPSAHERVRSVACISLGSTVGTGRSCAYTTSPWSAALPRSDYELASNHWDVTVYEIHSGGILHKGQIFTSTSHCPHYIQPSSTDTQVTNGLTQEQVMDWITSHFVDGKPH
ncbi:MAG: hypothetical protein U0P45_13225 [Acidimicrobiales bacterium]